jgi:hypothetical protein
MHLHCIGIVACLLIAASPASAQTGVKAPADPLALRGGNPVNWGTLPDVPPTGFHAFCNTARGSCLVQGNAPIAPGTVCHCGEYPGRTL